MVSLYYLIKWVYHLNNCNDGKIVNDDCIAKKILLNLHYYIKIDLGLYSSAFKKFCKQVPIFIKTLL